MPINVPEIAILASGNGTTAEALIESTQPSERSFQLAANIGLVICNNKNAGIFNLVDRLNHEYGLAIKTMHVSAITHPGGPARPGEQTDEEADTIAKALRGYDMYAAMGYMKKIRGAVFDAPILGVNCHPGPLPATKGLWGKHVQEEVLRKGLAYSGPSVNAIDSDYDTGTVISYVPVPVELGDTVLELQRRVQNSERAAIPFVVNSILHGGFMRTSAQR